MKKHFFCLSIFIIIAFSCNFSYAQENKFSKLYKKASPATVLIKTDYIYTNPLTKKTFYTFTKCSGSFIRSNGTILTSDHCVDVLKKEDLSDPDGNLVSAQIVYKPDHVTVFVGPRQYQARIVILDQTLHFALLKINGHRFPFFKFSSLRPEIGQTVLTIANSNNGKNVLKVGTIAAINNETPSSLLPVNFIKSDLALSRGESGGPLLNIDGELLGINESRDTESTISSSVMIDGFLKFDILKFIRGQTVIRPYLNIDVNDLGLLDESVTRSMAQEIRKKIGVNSARHQGIVVRVTDQSDIKPDDILTAFNGVKIIDYFHFSRLIFTSQPYKPARPTLLRTGKEIKVIVTLPVKLLMPIR